MLDRRVTLVLDAEKGSLGGIALQLVRLGVDAHYSNDLDEAGLLARDAGASIRSIVLPSSSTAKDVDSALETLGPLTGAGPERYAVIGKRPDEEAIEVLREKGIRWRLWEPFEEKDLRFVALAPMWFEDDCDLRLDVRFPTTLSAKATHRGDTRPVVVGDLTLGGAFLENGNYLPAGRRIDLEISFPDGPIVVGASVRWVNPPGKRTVEAMAPGVGVEFLELAPAAQETLQRQLTKERERFRI